MITGGRPLSTCVWLLTAFFALGGVSAEAQIGVRVGIDPSALIAPNEVIRVPLMVSVPQSSTSQIATLEGRVTWRTSRLSFVSATVAPDRGLTLTTNTSEVGSGTLRFNVYGASNLTGTGPAAWLEFRGVSAGGTPIEVLPSLAADDSGGDVLASVQSERFGTCVAQAIRWGDVTGDGAVNVIDAQQIARFSVSLPTNNLTGITTAGDVTGDGSVNVIDAQQIARFSIGMSSPAKTNTVVNTIPRADSLIYSPDTLAVLMIGESIRLNAEPVGSDGTKLFGCHHILWSSSDSTLATVSSDGMVTAISAGAVTITMRADRASRNIALQTHENTAPALTGTSLAVGQAHACALNPQGEAHCWGINNLGQLGSTEVGATPYSPLKVTTEKRFVTLVAGTDHTCALTVEGSPYCWGRNAGGALGSGTESPFVFAPERVMTDEIFSQLSAGANSTCGVTKQKQVLCWGSNEHGQLGNGTKISSGEPVGIQELIDITQVSVGQFHACALNELGVVLCWGNNSAGQLGTGYQNEGSATPVQVSGATRFKALPRNMGSTHSCAIERDNSELFCWGNGDRGQLGTSTKQSSGNPTRVVNSSGASSASLGGYHTCITYENGNASCWGSNSHGELGTGDGHERLTPTPPASVELWRVVIAKDRNTCGVALNGLVHCWGDNDYRQLGRAGRTPEPRRVTLEKPVNSLSAGLYHACARNAEGDVQCWGWNYNGEFADGTLSQKQPEPSMIRLSLASINHGTSHACGINDHYEAYCWGANHQGALGDSSTEQRLTPAKVKTNIAFASIDAGNGHTCGIAVDSSAYCWGANGFGQLGNASQSDTLVPTEVHGTNKFVQIVSSDRSTCGIESGGAAFCWGFNEHGTLGTGDTEMRLSPTPVLGGLRFTELASSFRHTCGIEFSGSLFCWGSNSSGQLGNGSVQTAQTQPVPVSIQAPIRKVATGAWHSCAIRSDRAAFCWGDNRFGQIGNGSEDDRALQPMPVAGGIQFEELALGAHFSCGLSTLGSVWCWGSSEYASVGLWSRAFPLPLDSRFVAKVW